VPTYSDAFVLACKMKLFGRYPTREDVDSLLKSRTLFEEFQHAFDYINKQNMCLPWTVHEWIAEVANNPLVIDFVLDRFHTCTERDLRLLLDLKRRKEPETTKEEPEPKKEPETVKEEPEPQKEFGFLTPMTFPTENPNFFTHPLGC